MSEENVEIMRRTTDAFNRSGEPDFGLIDPDVVIDTTGAVFDRAVYRGHDGIRRWLASNVKSGVANGLKREELIPVGEDRVLASFRLWPVGAADDTNHSGRVATSVEELETAGRGSRRWSILTQSAWPAKVPAQVRRMVGGIP
jgi:hypothetical protein